jgi:lipooligosaccharide transport system permease protein
MLFRFVIGPLFLFSGTFFPIDRLPLLLQAVAWALPLSHGVAICRDVVLNTANAADLGHAAILAAYVIAGAAAARITLDRRLRQ